SETEPGERHERRVTEPFGRLDNLTECRVRSGRVAPFKGTDRHWQQEISELHAVLMCFVEQPLGAGEPASAACHLAPVQQPESEPERASRGSRHIPSAHALCVGARPDVGAFVLPAGQLSGYRELLEVLKLE